MNVREIMTTDVTKATPNNTLVDIAMTMRDEDIGAVPVVEDGQLLGIVTDRDIVIRAIADGRKPSDTRVEEVLSEEVESVAPDTDVTDAAEPNGIATNSAFSGCGRWTTHRHDLLGRYRGEAREEHGSLRP